VRFLKEREKQAAVEDVTPNTVIGVGSTLRGTLMVEGTLRVEGEFDGDLLNCDRLEVGPHGTVRVDVHVRDAYIEGQMHGSVQAEGRVVLLSGARVDGDLTCRRVVIEDGVHFTGRCVMVDEGEPFPASGSPADLEDIRASDLQVAAGYRTDKS
jgi:cytoskeletal protein CcmA (bactofilin family)